MSTRVSGWRTAPEGPAPSEVVHHLRATAAGRPWRLAGGASSGAVEVTVTASSVTLSSPSGIHLLVPLDEVSHISSLRGRLAIETLGGRVSLQAPRAERRAFGRELRLARQLSRAARETADTRAASPDPPVSPAGAREPPEPTPGPVRAQIHLPPPALPRYPERVADSLMLLALTHPRGRWSQLLRHAVTAGCLVDLEWVERIEMHEGDPLRVIDDRPTGSAGHDLALARMAHRELRVAGSWMHHLSNEVPWALRGAAESEGAIGARRRRGWGPLARFETDITDAAYVGELRSELRGVYQGASDDPLATTVFSLVAAASLTELLPGSPGRKAVYRRLRELPADPVVDDLRAYVGSLLQSLAQVGGAH